MKPGFKLNLGVVEREEITDGKPEAQPYTPIGKIIEEIEMHKKSQRPDGASANEVSLEVPENGPQSSPVPISDTRSGDTPPPKYNWGDLLGLKLHDSKGGLVDAGRALAKKDAVGLYFCTHSLPPCRLFTPKLIYTYNSIKALDKSQKTGDKRQPTSPFEVVLISGDVEQADFIAQHKTMPWLALPFPDDSRASNLRKKYSITGMPTLVLLSSDGELITKDGKNCILNDSKGEQFHQWRNMNFKTVNLREQLATIALYLLLPALLYVGLCIAAFAIYFQLQGDGGGCELRVSQWFLVMGVLLALNSSIRLCAQARRLAHPPQMLPVKLSRTSAQRDRRRSRRFALLFVMGSVAMMFTLEVIWLLLGHIWVLSADLHCDQLDQRTRWSFMACDDFLTIGFLIHCGYLYKQQEQRERRASISRRYSAGETSPAGTPTSARVAHTPTTTQSRNPKLQSPNAASTQKHPTGGRPPNSAPHRITSPNGNPQMMLSPNRGRSIPNAVTKLV